MPPDPLAVLARLRSLETRAAQQRLATQLGRAAAAAARVAAAEGALLEERGAGSPADYAAWLPRALAERERAALAERQAEDSLHMAQAALAECRAAERAVERLREQRTAEARRRSGRRQQMLLDDAAQRFRRQ
ncbi:MAG: hypothetical protein QJR07_21085 [Acetobacteraceae bacterium]|nr:hypothetical protein [Acetobacteraceae bacterium]MDI3309573.1 hypothetical protein [Acetobacteraceae bacterium]